MSYRSGYFYQWQERNVNSEFTRLQKQVGLSVRVFRTDHNGIVSSITQEGIEKRPRTVLKRVFNDRFEELFLQPFSKFGSEILIGNFVSGYNLCFLYALKELISALINNGR